MEYLEYTAFTKADRALAWKLFSDFRFWPAFSDVYGPIGWTKGQPWTPGSRLRIEIVRPVKAIVDHVITICSPGEQVAWIDHFLGNTMVQWVTFESLPDGGTRVHTWAEVTGSTTVVDGYECSDFLRSFMRRWYDSFCSACDQLAEGQMVGI
ncbi:MAG TPA: hypothetical protein VKH81_08630 [Candidatus Angelobacter sp.]|nr:hypothetical protein [Candidatus Angelobacter sp.]